ncbi:MAG TPA: hypothetical protein VF608_13020, partial [Thermoanaerobaculia bacterium]
VSVLDMSTPNAPITLGAILVADQADDVAISGAIALAAVQGQIEVISLADPRNPVIVGRLTTNGYYHRVTIDGTLAAALDEELQRYAFIDVTNPAIPVVTAFLPNSASAADLTLSGTLLLGATSAIEEIDVTNRNAPVRLPGVATTLNTNYLNIAATNRVVVAEETRLNPQGEGLALFRPQPPTFNNGIGRYAATAIEDVAVADCRAYYVTVGELRTLDISGCAANCATCIPSDTNVCLANGRFSVSANWRTASAQGVAHRVSISDNTAGFWFFGPANTEMLFKVLDGCVVNNRHWFFAGGLTDVEVTITVRDTKTNATKTYVNPLGRSFQTITDTDAFGCP